MEEWKIYRLGDLVDFQMVMHLNPLNSSTMVNTKSLG